MTGVEGESLESRFVAELADLADSPIVFQASWLEWWSLMATAQLAMRHPEYTGPTREIVERLVRRMQAVLAPGGALAEVAEQGWRPEYDVPGPAPRSATGGPQGRQEGVK
jgi:hypothetical protein